MDPAGGDVTQAAQAAHAWARLDRTTGRPRLDAGRIATDLAHLNQQLARFELRALPGPAVILESTIAEAPWSEPHRQRILAPLTGKHAQYNQQRGQRAALKRERDNDSPPIPRTH